MTYFIWLIFIFSAILEVGGDAVIRKGLRGRSFAIVNTVKWDFSKLLSVYIAVFALVSVLFGRFVFRESIPSSTWIGLIVIISGAMIVQFGNRM